MNPDQIDYRPLQAMSHAWLTVMRTTYKGSLWLLGIVVSALGIYVTMKTRSWAGAVGIVLYCVLVGWLINKYKNKVWLQFAIVNGWSTDAVTSGEGVIPPSLQFGHDHDFSPIIKADLRGLACDIFAYNCTTGSGKTSQTHYFTVAVTELPKAMPHMLLRTKHGDAGIENDMENTETLHLEGDFDNYFQLQIEKGQEIDALTIITPDVMQTLVNYSQSEDLEILGTRLSFIVRGDKRGTEPIKQLIASVVELNGQLLENARLSTPVLT